MGGWGCACRPTLPLPSPCDKLTCACSGPPPAVVLEFKHNVCGREVYAEGTVDAAIFLHRQVGCARCCCLRCTFELRTP